MQQLRPGQRAAFVNRLKSLLSFSRVVRGQRLNFFVAAGDDDNGERLLVNVLAAGQLVMWHKKKVRLVAPIRRILDEECSAARGGRSAKEPV